MIKYSFKDGVLHKYNVPLKCAYKSQECNINCAKLVVTELIGQQMFWELNICGSVVRLEKHEFSFD